MPDGIRTWRQSSSTHLFGYGLNTNHELQIAELSLLSF